MTIFYKSKRIIETGGKVKGNKVCFGIKTNFVNFLVRIRVCKEIVVIQLELVNLDKIVIFKIIFFLFV